MAFIKRSDAKDYAYIILGMLIYAIGFTAFILPHNIVIGGMAGFSTLVYYASAKAIPVSVVMYGTNVLLLLCGFKFLGRTFVVRTIFGATLLSVLIGCMESYFTHHPPLVSDITMSVVLGSMMCGLGIGFYYSHHGTAGGTDIIAAIMSKISNMSVGRVMMIVDMSIVACSFFLPYDGDMEARVQVRTQIIMYGWLAIFIYSYITDKFLSSDRQTVQFFILSDKWHEIADRITKETGRGVTTWNATGFWTGTDRTMLMVWARKYDSLAIFKIVDEVDEHAYITNSYVRNVYGNGFDMLNSRKSSEKKK
jgi:uncharacterized membrane-anchored protein YitT (DUF2179 family)